MNYSVKLVVFCLFLTCVELWSNRSIAMALDAELGDGHSVNSEFVDKMSWSCANNASCLYTIANSVLKSYNRGETVQFGIFNLAKLPPAKNLTTHTGRAAGLIDFISGNSLRVPVGPMVFSLQRAEDDDNYIEVALLKKASSHGRRHDGDEVSRLGEDNRLGGGGGVGGNNHRHRVSHKDKKQFQMFIPMYLAATTFGWTMLAVKAVGILTLKALAISKLAFLVATAIIVKKLMDNASQKMMYDHYPEHQPFIMPYNMDYGMHPIGAAEIATSDLYPAAIHLSGQHPGLESLGAESNIHQHAIDMQNNTQVLAALNAAGLGQKVKRDDTWSRQANRPVVYNYVPQHHPLFAYRN